MFEPSRKLQVERDITTIAKATGHQIATARGELTQPNTTTYEARIFMLESSLCVCQPISYA
jgi:hypothetical protein